MCGGEPATGVLLQVQADEDAEWLHTPQAGVAGEGIGSPRCLRFSLHVSGLRALDKRNILENPHRWGSASPKMHILKSNQSQGFCMF